MWPGWRSSAFASVSRRRQVARFGIELRAEAGDRDIAGIEIQRATGGRTGIGRAFLRLQCQREVEPARRQRGIELGCAAGVGFARAGGA